MAFEKLVRDFAAFALKQCRKQTAREEKAYLKRKAKYDRWLALQPYDVQRASLIATLRDWKLKLVHVDDLVDAVRLGGTHWCAFTKGISLFKKNHIGASSADDYGSAAKRLISTYVPELDKSVEELKMILAIEKGV